MSQRSRRCSEFSTPAVVVIRQRAELLVSVLPDPGEPFAAHDGFDGVCSVDIEGNRLRSLRTYGIIEEVGRRRPDHRDGGGRSPIYELSPAAASRAQHALNQAWCPLNCGHRGLENPRGVDGYTCSWDRCDEVTAPEEVRR
jgi:hypothetical protein